jgi:hypothetical protein
MVKMREIETARLGSFFGKGKAAMREWRIESLQPQFERGVSLRMIPLEVLLPEVELGVLRGRVQVVTDSQLKLSLGESNLPADHAQLLKGFVGYKGMMHLLVESQENNQRGRQQALSLGFYQGAQGAVVVEALQRLGRSGWRQRTLQVERGEEMFIVFLRKNLTVMAGPKEVLEGMVQCFHEETAGVN